MPVAVLAAIVFLIGVELVDILEYAAILAMRPREFWVALLTAAIVVVVGVEQAIIAAMALSLISHVRRGYSPQNSVLVPVADRPGRLHSAPVATGGQAAPGPIVYRFTHGLYYANAERFLQETRTDEGGGAALAVRRLRRDRRRRLHGRGSAGAGRQHS